VFLVSCAEPTPEYVEGMINLGDEIDGMVFKTDKEFDMYRAIPSFCGWELKDKTGTTYYFECAASPGEKIFFGNCINVQAATTKDLDDNWNKLEKVEIT